MDTAWAFREAYNEGKLLKEKQERWCESPKTQTEPFPQDLQWEVMADILRGNVKVNIHCYETTDLNALVRISNEFKFPIAAFHHAHETYLVPDLLKQAWGPVPPAVALFATNARYKRESYRGSEFAPKILADAGIEVNMKSDHPVLNSRYLIYEAAQAHHYGLNFSLAMSSVTSTPAKSIGLDHRMGYVRPGYDADIVVWDSFPLSLGATPKQTYIDGIPQIINPHVTPKPAEAQKITPAGEYDDQAAEALATRGDPDLRPKKQADAVIFQDVSALYLGEAVRVLESGDRVVIKGGKMVCVGECVTEEDVEYEVIDLKGGSFTPGLVSVGSGLGMREIVQEPSTRDGVSPCYLNTVISLIHRPHTTQLPLPPIWSKAFSSMELTVSHSVVKMSCMSSPPPRLIIANDQPSLPIRSNHSNLFPSLIPSIRRSLVRILHFRPTPTSPQRNRKPLNSSSPKFPNLQRFYIYQDCLYPPTTARRVG
jgi:imidazolonepropionase-like amidohydrolase